MKITLKAARVNARLTQVEVAKVIGKTKTTIQNYENGKSIPDVEMAKRLTSLYGVSIDDVIFSPQSCALSTNGG